MWAQLASLLIGLWLMASPSVLGYPGTTAADIERICGPIVATSACVAIWRVTRPVRWINVGIGAWLVVGPWILGLPWPALVNQCAAGVLLCVLSPIGRRSFDQLGGGWSVLWRGWPDRT